MTTPPYVSSELVAEETDEDFEVIDLKHLNDSLCDVSEDTYLSLPEEVLAMSTITDLQNAVENCKAMILSKPENSLERKWLARRLIELRLRMESLKEVNSENLSEKNLTEMSKVILGHHFCLQNFPTSTLYYYCDRCSGIIWNILHSWYLCSDCEYKCHVKCVTNICRVCAYAVVSENPVYIIDICPEAEHGIASQNYRCAECLTHTSFPDNRKIVMRKSYSLEEVIGNKLIEPRICDYTGKYYCSTCHWNSTSVIPARVIFNWDFSERIVCRSSKQILKLMAKLPILKLEELNPILFACIEELATVKQLRHQLMQIKKYLTSCKLAIQKQLLWQSTDKHHFLENEENYSLQDLMELHSGELIKYLKKVQSDFIKHIKVDCEVCLGRGFFCELCKKKKVIFPFEENVMSCSKCESTFHFFCWIKNNQECPKCHRMQQRLLKNQSDAFIDS